MLEVTHVYINIISHQESFSDSKRERRDRETHISIPKQVVEQNLSLVFHLYLWKWLSIYLFNRACVRVFASISFDCRLNVHRLRRCCGFTYVDDDDDDGDVAIACIRPFRAIRLNSVM